MIKLKFFNFLFSFFIWILFSFTIDATIIECLTNSSVESGTIMISTLFLVVIFTISKYSKKTSNEAQQGDDNDKCNKDEKQEKKKNNKKIDGDMTDETADETADETTYLLKDGYYPKNFVSKIPIKNVGTGV